MCGCIYLRTIFDLLLWVLILNDVESNKKKIVFKARVISLMVQMIGKLEHLYFGIQFKYEHIRTKRVLVAFLASDIHRDCQAPRYSNILCENADLPVKTYKPVYDQ